MWRTTSTHRTTAKGAITCLSALPLFCWAAAALLVFSPVAQASSTYPGIWNGVYPSSSSSNNASCLLCHTSNAGGLAWNAYGFAIFKATGLIAARISSVQSQNSDGNPASNLTEINASAQPGWTTGSNNAIFNSAGQTGTVAAPAGIAGNLDPAFTVGGTLSGLTGTVTLRNNGGNDLIRSANGTFTFSTALATGSAYSVTVSSQPTGQTCTVSNGSGTIASANVANVAVSCVTNPPVDFTVGGTVSGLTGSVTLRNNGGNDLIRNANGSFTFAALLTTGSAYSVTVFSQPAGQTCTVANGSGTIASANINNVAVSCVTNTLPTFMVGGAISGLTGVVTLRNNGGNDLVSNTNGSFTFSTSLTTGSAYSVTVSIQPTGQTCTVGNGSGTIGSANITNVAVNCVTNSTPTFTVGGTVSGLTGSVTLRNNGGNDLIRNANGSFTFATALAPGSVYAVTVSSQPAGQTCTVSSGSGTIASANVTNVVVTCSTIATSPGVDLNQHGLTGAWYEPATSGQGFGLEVFPNRTSGTGQLFVTWFTFDTVIGGAERQRWYTAQGEARTGVPTASLTIYQNIGGNFNAPPATTAQPVGTATLRFDTCSSGELTYTFTDGTGRTGTIPLTRLLPNVTCSVTTTFPTNADFALSGTWYGGAATSGQGFSVDVAPNLGAFFLSWFTYISNGTGAGAAGQRWFTAQGTFAPGLRVIPVQIFETVGGRFDTATPAGQTTVPVGTGTMTYQSCSAATFAYTFTGGSLAGRSGTITLSRVGPLPPGCTP